MSKIKKILITGSVMIGSIVAIAAGNNVSEYDLQLNDKISYSGNGTMSHQDKFVVQNKIISLPKNFSDYKTLSVSVTDVLNIWNGPKSYSDDETLTFLTSDFTTYKKSEEKNTKEIMVQSGFATQQSGMLVQITKISQKQISITISGWDGSSFSTNPVSGYWDANYFAAN